MSKIEHQAAAYVTTNRQEFKTEAEAKAHQELVDAQTAVREADERWQRALFESQVTADGQPMKLMKELYYLRRNHDGMPWVQSFEVRSRNFFIHEDFGTIQLHVDPRPRSFDSREWRRIDLEDLYGSREAADAECLRLSRARLLELEQRWLPDGLLGALGKLSDGAFPEGKKEFQSDQDLDAAVWEVIEAWRALDGAEGD